MVFQVLCQHILFMCGLGQCNRYSDFLGPGDPEDQILVRARYPHSTKTGCLAHPASYTRVQGHSKGYSNRDVTLTTHPYVVPRLKEEYSYTYAPKLCLYFNIYGSVHRKNILIYGQQDATLHRLFYLETALHVSGGGTTRNMQSSFQIK